ncbi:MAG: Do family serine endopeptidase [Aquificae bacterium]|nr:Do family serine endopeptidase [Aquificota bacterium]
MNRKFLSIFFVLLTIGYSYAGLMLKQFDREIVDIVEDVSPAVVTIFTIREVKVPNPFRDLPFGEFFGFPPDRDFTQRVEGLGSGFIVKVDEKKKLVYIITNNHVIENATNIQVKFKNKKVLDAKVIGKDKLSDIAIIAVPFKKGIENYAKKHILKFGNSDKLKQGNLVIAIGNPLGLDGTVTMGIISALDRSIEGHPGEGFIQTDAAINPGNSGGPLVNIDGEVVGINTAIIAGAQGLGFAVPANQAKWVMEHILKYGKVKRGKIGVIIQPLTPDLAEHFNVEHGVVVSKVIKGGPADKAGIKPGDVIVAVNGNPVEDPNDVQKYVMRTEPGKYVTLTIIRDGKKLNIKVKTVPWEEEIDVSNLRDLEIKYGIIVRDITPEIRQRYGLPKIPHGVLVIDVKPGSPADEAGLRTGDIIISVNKKPIKTAEEFWKEIQKAKAQGKKSVLLYVQRGYTSIWTTLPIIK